MTRDESLPPRVPLGLELHDAQGHAASLVDARCVSPQWPRLEGRGKREEPRPTTLVPAELDKNLIETMLRRGPVRSAA